MTARPVYRGPWRVDVDVRDRVQVPIARSTLVAAIAAALEAAGAPRPASIGLVLSDDEELAGLNEEHMAGSGPTDVLSFPLLPPDAYPPHVGAARTPDGAARAARAAASPRFVVPPHRRAHLGDIVVSVERAVEQAATGRGGHEGATHWSAGDELRLLVTHGALHVCGWDHADAVEGAAMRAIERRLLGMGPVGQAASATS